MYVALLRAINVGGHKKVAMAELRRFVEQLGFADVRSLLQTGNLVFQSTSRKEGVLDRLLEEELAKRLGLRTAVFVRSAKTWREMVARNPFADAAQRDPSHLVVMFLKDAPKASAVEALQAAIQGPELVRAEGKQLYAAYPAGIGRSTLTNKLIEGTLATQATGRNWNTVLKLAAMCEA